MIKNIVLLILLMIISYGTFSIDNGKINKLVIHVTDTDDKHDIGAHEIDVLHRYFNNWENGCGYHYVIRRTGQIEICRDESLMGAHVRGANEKSLGIVWVGREDMTKTQYDALKRLIKRLLNKHNLTVEDVYPHNHFESAKIQNKSCPNMDVELLKKEIKNEGF